MQTLFEYGDKISVLNPSCDKIEPIWNSNTHSLDIELVTDKSANTYHFVKGTNYVLSYNDDCFYGVWKGGLLGILIGSANTLTEALDIVKRDIPGHIVYKAKKKSGIIGYRERL